MARAQPLQPVLKILEFSPTFSSGITMASFTSVEPGSSSLTPNKRSFTEDTRTVSHKRLRLSPPPLTPPESHPSTPTTNPSTPRAEHTRPKIYICTRFPPCLQAFDRPCRLSEHERSHTGDRPFACTVSPETCNKTFQRDYHLSRHIRHAHAPDEATAKPFVCTFELDLGSTTGSLLGDEGDIECGKAFATRQRLELHERTHKNKPRCAEMVADGSGGFRRCAAVFRKEVTLQAHVDKVHRGVKPFVCRREVQRAGEHGQEKRACDAGYDTLGKLNEHVRRCHSGPKYMCGICSGSESLSDEQMSTDDGDEKIEPVAFDTLSELAAHNRLVHSVKKGERQDRATASQSTHKQRTKPKKRANQHTQRLADLASVPAADMLTGRPLLSNELAPLLDAMDISGPAFAHEELRCLNVHCLAMFASAAQLGEHCTNMHGMAETQVAEELREQEALRGGVFWLGGLNGAEAELGWNWGSSIDGVIDPALTETLK
jgi:uncharacterized C2H2 Zn-finger protein